MASVYIMQPVLSELAGRFGVSGNDARLAFSVVSIAYALAFFFLGPLSDRVEPRTMATIGLLGAAIAVGLGSFVDDYRHLLILLAVQGAFAAMVPAAMFTLMPSAKSCNRTGLPSSSDRLAPTVSNRMPFTITDPKPLIGPE